jgi:hypothetical protein
VQWICTELLLALAALLNFMPRKLGSLWDHLSFSLTQILQLATSDMSSGCPLGLSCWTSSSTSSGCLLVPPTLGVSAQPTRLS